MQSPPLTSRKPPRDTLRVTVLAGSILVLSSLGLPPASAQIRFGSTPSSVSSSETPSGARVSDFILAVVNQEAVTAGEVQRRTMQWTADLRRANAETPSQEEMRGRILEVLIDERVVLTHARSTGGAVDEAEIDRAFRTVASQNQIDVGQLRERLLADGLDLNRFRAQLRDQLLVERVRDREVSSRVSISESEVDAFMADRRREAQAQAEINLAQILVAVPEGADPAELARLEARAMQALARVRAGEPFERVAREMSDDPRREEGGVLGLRPPSRLPDLFVDAARPLRAGEVAPTLLRSGAGFHVLKLVGRAEVSSPREPQTRVRHILLRSTDRQTVDQARARLEDIRNRIDRSETTFEEAARRVSEDGSAPQGGDLGWAVPGMMVPEFEQVMDALPVGTVSEPVLSRFGVHLIQVLERREVVIDERQQRERARAALRERKFDEAYAEWVRELRGRAYIEMREPPG